MRFEKLRRTFFSAQFIGFVGVGVTAAICNWGARHVLEAAVGFAWAVALAYAVGFVVAFTLNRTLVFPRASTSIHHQVSYFTFANLVSFPIVWGASMTMSQLILPGMGWTWRVSDVAHLVALGLPAAVSFLIHKFYTFARIER